MERKTDPANALTARAGSESPMSKCPICLTQIDNPAFTDMCIHQFCFTCLCEWAKVKAVCPVCKQQFQTIAYNVQSYEKFDELPVKNLTVPDPRTEFQINRIVGYGVTQIHGQAQDARFRYRTTMTADYRDVLRRLEEQRITEELRNPLVRITLNHRAFVFSSEARKAVYRTGLRVQHLQTPNEQVFSLITPQFFHDNPACKIRLSPWLQRELDVLAELSDIPVIGDTMYLINLILSLLNTVKITSQNFYNRLYPCLRRHTLHFLQELYCFARSAPYTMPQYDSCVVYGDGTSGAIWSLWHRDKAHSNSRIPTAVRNTTREEITQLPSERGLVSFAARISTMEEITRLPSERGLVSFAVRNSQRDANQRSATLVQGTSGTRANATGLIDLVSESSDSNSDVEVMGQEPPWDARLPIVISDSEEETTDREASAKNTKKRKSKHLVSKPPREDQDYRISRDPSQNSVNFENELGYLLSELSDESELQGSQHSSQKRKIENKSAGGRRDTSEMSEDANVSHQHKTRHCRSSSVERQKYSKNNNQSDAKKQKSKDKKRRRNHPQEEHSDHSKDLRQYNKRFSTKHSSSTEQQRPCKSLSGEGSRAYRRSHSKEQSRTGHQRITGKFKERYLAYRRSRSKERARDSQRSLSKERPRARRQSHSKEHQSSRSRELHREHRDRHSDHTLSHSPEISSCCSEALNGCLKERLTLQGTKRKRRISEKTPSCDSSETDVYSMPANRANVCHYCSVSPSSADSQSSSIDNPNLSNGCGSLASYGPSLVGKAEERHAELRLRTDDDSSTHSYIEIDSGVSASDGSHEDARISSNVAEENSELIDASFIRKTDFWSDEEENDEDNVLSRSKTLKSQIGCMLLAGNGETSSFLELLPSDEELNESPDCSSSSRWHFSEGYDTNEANCSYKSKKRKDRSRSSTGHKKSHNKHKKERRDVSTDLGASEASCSRESQQSKKHRHQSHTRCKNRKRERRNLSADSREYDKVKSNIENHTNLGLATNRFYENEARHRRSDTDESLNAANELKFKKHFTGHKNSPLKKTKC